MRKARGQQRVRIAAVAAGVSAVTLIGTLSLAAPGAPPGPSFGDDPSICAMVPPTNLATPTPEQSELLPPMLMPLPFPSTPPESDPSHVPADPTQYPTLDPVTDPTQYPTVDPVATPIATPMPGAGDQITCFLRSVVTRYAPGAAASGYEEPGEAPLLLHDNMNSVAGGYVASASLSDASGWGLFEVYVGLPKNAVQPRTACAPQPCTAQAGPHGEHIESYTTIDNGRVGYAVYVWSGEKLTILMADNNAQRPAPFRPSPFFTMNQLIEIGCDPVMTTM